MKKKLIALAAAAAAVSVAGAAFAAGGDVPLIPREKLFGNPSRVAGRLSPDGKYLSWIAPRDGVLNIWVAPTANLAAAKPLTAEKVRPIRSGFWSPDSRQILYVNDQGGDENFQLYGVDVATGAGRALTSFPKTRVQIVGISSHVKDRMLIAINNRDPKWHDVYSLDFASGKLSPVLVNEGGYAGFRADDQLSLRIASKARPDGGTDYYRIVAGKVEAQPFEQVALEDAQTTTPTDFTSDGKTLYWVDSRGRDTAAIFAQDLATGKKTLIGEDPRADVTGGLGDPQTGRIQAYAVNYLRNDWVPVGTAIKGDLAYLKAKLPGQIGIASRTDADDKWIVTVDPVTAPASTWLYDRKTKALTKLFVSRPELEGATLAPMQAIEIRTRDGMTMVSYLTLPPGTPVDARGRPLKPVPLVLFPHGGPWGRDVYGYNPYAQWLANRGYAVLMPNFRASLGFGKKFLAAGNLQWGLKMHDDLIDAVDWAVANGVTRQDEVAIMGGSYGGYAVLAGMTVTPDRFRCGVDLFGPSNLNTLLKTIPPYWEALKAQMYKRMGDPTTPEGQAVLKAASPMFSADRITRPLLIGQGANDPRVNIAESQQIVDALKAKGTPVTYIVFPDEGHGFVRPANNIAMNAVAENFLAKCLGGRAEPIGGAIKASSGKVAYGAEHVDGLAAAAGS